MKTYSFPGVISLLFLVLLITAFSSCLKDECDETRVFLEYEPVYVQAEAFRVDIETSPARNMEETGKFYFFNDYILINEKYAGIHVLDNSDPANPVNIAFIEIPGNLDMAIKGNILYADSYVDLLSIDISDLDNPVITCRDEDVFANYHLDPNLGYFVYHRTTERRVTIDCSDPNFGSDMFWRGGNILWLEDAATGGPLTAGGDVPASGIAGSFARFSLAHDYLYVLNQHDLVAYNVDDPAKPVKTSSTRISWGMIETLFPYEDYLFIGANNGMYIYDASVPSSPVYVSEFQHARACDPVFVNDDVAFVTLRDGTMCESFSNQLDVIDISDISKPTLIATYEMDHPHGLSVDESILYLCEGSHGLKVFDITDLREIGDNRRDHIKNIHAFDAIYLGNDHLLIIGEDGLYQYDTRNPGDLREISYFPVLK